MAARKIYFNIQTGELLTSNISPSVLSGSPVALFAGDTVDLEFYPLNPTGDPASPFAAATLPGGATFKLGIKPTDDYEGTYLCFEDTFASITNGISCTLSLNTSGLDNALATTDPSAEFIAELEMVSAGNATTLVQWTQLIKNQVNIGSEGLPTDPSPTYPTTTEMQAFVQGGDSTIQQFHRSGLGSGVSSLTVTFTDTQATANWHFDAAYFENTTDADPDQLTFVLTAKSTTGFTVKFSGPTSTANTTFVWKINQDPT